MMTDAKRAVVLLSGGMDSLVTAAIAVRDNRSVCFLHVNYGQRTETKELECFKKITDHYKPEKALVIKMNWLGQMGGSALTDKNIPIEIYNGNPIAVTQQDAILCYSCSGKKEIPLTYVPFRNANLISAAVAWAEVNNAVSIYIGAVEADSSGYPDCRKEFFNNLQKAIDTGKKSPDDIRIETPIIDMSKSDIVRLGMALSVPFEHSWSCYKDNFAACGKCDSCQLRLRAFKQAGVEDPLPYSEREIL